MSSTLRILLLGLGAAATVACSGTTDPEPGPGAPPPNAAAGSPQGGSSPTPRVPAVRDASVPGDDASPADGGVGLDAGADGDGGDAPDPAPTYGPHVVSSEPAEGSRIYPRELYDGGPGRGIQQRKRIVLTFSEPMDGASGPVELRKAGAAEAVPAAAEWSADGLTLTLTVAGDSEQELPPLEDDTAYAVDLRGLRARSGAALDPRHPHLGDGVLDFATTGHDELLAHTCFHTFYGPFSPTTATATAAAAPLVRSLHRQYNTALTPVAGGNGGFVNIALSYTGTKEAFVFLSEPAPALLRRPDGSAAPMVQEPTAPACPGIRSVLRGRLEGRVTHALQLGPTASASLAFLLEAP